MNWKIYHFNSVKSTNDTACSYPIGTVVFADKQTNGRGRHGRLWISQEGNLFVSFVLPEYGYQTPLLSFITAVSVKETLDDFGFSCQIKWPNDILLNHKKIAGILLEQHDDKVIVGIGINLKNAPCNDDVLYPATALNTLIGKHEIILALCHKITKNLSIFNQNGFDIIRHKWLQSAVGINERIFVRLPHETISGIFTQLTPQGAISLKLDDDTVRFITAGDVFFNKKEIT